MHITVQQATPDQADVLTQIAHEAKRHWGYPETWIALWRDTLTITPGFIARNKAYVALIDGEVAGFYVLIDAEEKVTLDHMWLRPGYIGRGIGRVLFTHAVETAASLGASSIEIEADPNAEGFYLRMGARRIGENQYEIEGSPRFLPLLIVNFEAL
jgi:GNAT superfamily N-acetyltransferase